MRGRIIAYVALALFGLGINARTACANMTTITWTGNVTSGWDYTGVYGPANLSLAGGRFTYTVTMLNDLIDANHSLIYPGSLTLVYGGSATNTAQFSSGVMAINGLSSAPSGTYSDKQLNYTGTDGDQIQTITFSYFLDQHISDENVTNITLIYPQNHIGNSWDYKQTGTWIIPDGATYMYGFTEQHYENALTGQRIFAYANLIPTRMSVYTGDGPPPVSAAPEPAMWALMLFGCGGIGAALRTRQRKTTVA